MVRSGRLASKRALRPQPKGHLTTTENRLCRPDYRLFAVAKNTCLRPAIWARDNKWGGRSYQAQ